MVAPIDSKASFEVEGETFTLRLNFRSIALAEKHGINLLAIDSPELTMTDTAVLLKCMAVEEHPDFTENHALAVVAKAPDALAAALIELFDSFGGQKAPEGNVVRRKAVKAA